MFTFCGIKIFTQIRFFQFGYNYNKYVDDYIYNLYSRYVKTFRCI